MKLALPRLILLITVTAAPGLLLAGCSTKRQAAAPPAPVRRLPASPGLAPHSRTVGAIKLNIPKGAEGHLVLRDAKTRRQAEFRTQNEVLDVPAGDYELLYCYISAPAQDNSLWQAVSRMSAPGPMKVTIAPRDTRLDIGPPFTARVDVKKPASDRMEMNLNVTDAAGIAYTIMEQKPGAPQPGFKVFDAKGNTVWQGSFRYG